MSMIRTVCSSRSLRDKEARPHQGVWVELGWEGVRGGGWGFFSPAGTNESAMFARHISIYRDRI